MSPPLSIRALIQTVRKLLPGLAPASVGAFADTSDIWQLYHMTGGADSVRPAVIEKLSQRPTQAEPG